MTETHRTDFHERTHKEVPSVKDEPKSDTSEEQKDGQESETDHRPKSNIVQRSSLAEEVASNGDRPKSEFGPRPPTRQVSFKLHHEHTDKDEDATKQKQAEKSIVRKPVIRQCSFQHNQRRHDSHSDHDSHPVRHDSLHKKKSLADMLPELMKQFKTELGCKSFIANTRKAVDQKRLIKFEKPKEREWLKGSDMQAFYHTWQTSDDHLKDQTVRPRSVRRLKSLPRDFKVTESMACHRKPTKKALSEFGIVRECCSQPRMRIPSFHD